MSERISIVTDEISQDLGEVREFLDTHRVRAVELRTISGKRVPDVSDADLETLRAWARDGDPRILAVSPGIFKGHHDDLDEIERESVAVLPRAVELAADLGAGFVVAFSFERRGERMHPAALEALRSAAATCDSFGLPLLVENEPGHFAESGRDASQLLTAANHANLFANWDPLNSNRFDEESLESAVRGLSPRLRHVHVKNGVLAPGDRFARCGPLRRGEIDWPAHLRLLLDLGYSGYLGVETHYEPVKEGSAVVLRELREMCEEVSFWR